ncbi:hypothetical protein DSO57_1022768 [Entomophthora muscae]|uniref:Uncharacterized protein n=1 Tax=Entomophthora muscae TaxID=34485 RepID=A0ACC2T2Y4_9FUNG|nr:hypothetical protein DSO57_1022768 [Entomophthora muscae]
MRLLHEEEFTKLRRQREKDRSRSLYDMLPSQTRLTASEPASRNLSSPSTHSSISPNQRLSYQSPPRMLDHSPVPRMHDQSPVPRMQEPSPVPRMRSASSSNVQTPPPHHLLPQPAERCLALQHPLLLPRRPAQH